jgi:phosphoglycolate phosphatase-like HAD superfamily hydrolase
MRNQNRSIFLDFDGVLFDTVKEVYCTASISIEKYRVISEIDFDTDHYHLFKRFRYLATSAWTFYYILKVIDEMIDETYFEDRYRYYMDHQDVLKHKIFEETFFLTRKKLKETDEKSWHLLNIPYPFLETVKRLSYNYSKNLFIITTKDKETVLKLIQFHDLDFISEQIFVRDQYNRHHSKRNIIESILLQKRIEKSIFVDDSRKHLSDCENITGLKLFQPEWGYVKPGDSTTSEEEITREIELLLKRSS